jgi:LEA14-like dessication related protein
MILDCHRPLFQVPGPAWSDGMRRLLLTILLLGIAGCAGLGGTRDSVRVTVSAVEVLESTVFEQLYRITLRVQNRGEQAITIQGGSFDMAINGRDFGSGVSDSVVTVPAYADELLEVRMVSTLFGMFRLFQGLSEDGSTSISYEISGRFSADGFVGGVTFREEGEIALPQRGAGGTLPTPAD